LGSAGGAAEAMGPAAARSPATITARAKPAIVTPLAPVRAQSLKCTAAFVEGRLANGRAEATNDQAYWGAGFVSEWTSLTELPSAGVLHSVFTLILLSMLSCWTLVHCFSATWAFGVVAAQAARTGRNANANQDLDMKKSLPLRTAASSSEQQVLQAIFRPTADSAAPGRSRWRIALQPL